MCAQECPLAGDTVIAYINVCCGVEPWPPDLETATTFTVAQRNRSRDGRWHRLWTGQVALACWPPAPLAPLAHQSTTSTVHGTRGEGTPSADTVTEDGAAEDEDGRNETLGITWFWTTNLDLFRQSRRIPWFHVAEPQQKTAAIWDRNLSSLLN